MPTHFTQQPYDPQREPEAPPRASIMAIAWFPLAILFGCGIVYAAKFGHDRATAELADVASPAAANETLSAAFLLDPGEEPIIFAEDQQALRDHLSAPPGSPGSRTVVVSQPVQLRLIERDGEFARVVIVAGPRQGQRYWTKAERLVMENPAGEGQEPVPAVPEP